MLGNVKLRKAQKLFFVPKDQEVRGDHNIKASEEVQMLKMNPNSLFAQIKIASKEEDYYGVTWYLISLVR